MIRPIVSNLIRQVTSAPEMTDDFPIRASDDLNLVYLSSAD